MKDRARAGVTAAERTPAWEDRSAPPAEAPNVVVILFDDTGFSHFGCFGSDIDTPNIDRLAAGGLRYTNFHTTALCSPTRASLLSGRNHHSVGMRFLSNLDTGFTNCRGVIAPSAGTLAEVLSSNGYSTFALGKWHLANMEDCGPTGPFDHWPLQRGFDRFHGFLGGATDQFSPELVIDNHPVDPPSGDGYHLSEDIVDQAISMIGAQRASAPDRKFLAYLAFGATHSLHGPQYDSSQSTGHVSVLHQRSSARCGHGAPKAEAGCSSRRTRFWRPPPHVLEHGLHWPNWPSLQSTGQANSLQRRVCVSCGHILPPACEAARIVRLRLCDPVPHVRLH